MDDKMNAESVLSALKNDHQEFFTFGGRAWRANDKLQWGVGAIQPLVDGDDVASQQALLEAVLECLEPVDKSELAFSLCTDGRLPAHLNDGQQVPVREQMVGADIVSAFYAAEMLGERFYKDTNAPVADRVADVAAFLKENGLEPSSHVACGAGAGYEAILKNILVFSKNDAYLDRVASAVSATRYSDELQEDIIKATKSLLGANAYEGLSVQTFLDAAEKVSGKHAIAELKDDGRGVNGHVEEAIVRLRRPGFGVNTVKLAEMTDGRQVFVVSDDRMEKLAKLFGRGNDADYYRAYLALENFADAGHGTLAKGLPTWIVTER
jgi:hypothetical protein